MSSGWNPMTGRDAMGTRPPLAPFGVPTPGQGQPFIPHAGSPGLSLGGFNGFGAYGASAGHYGTSYQFPVAYQQQQQYQTQPWYYPYANQPNGASNIYTRHPQQYPNIDSNMPAAQMTNSSGGVGCEPGYNYFFPAEHTKVHIFRSTTPPWQLPAGAQIEFKAAHIPCTVTLAELLKGFGCTNENPKKNRCYEIIPGGNGTWYKGIGFNGADKAMMKMCVKDLGWDMSRSGHPREKPVVCLWFCKD